MTYTIGQVSEKMGISTYTLRYYDREGILPFVKRTASGIRIFDESDLEFLHVIHCLKQTGMSIVDIRSFIEWAREGDASIQKRYDLFQERKKEVDHQIALLETYRECIDFKCDYYEKALKAGTEAIHFNNDSNDLPLSKIIRLNPKEDKR